MKKTWKKSESSGRVAAGQEHGRAAVLDRDFDVVWSRESSYAIYDMADHIESPF
jgi:hypothetical protein